MCVLGFPLISVEARGKRGFVWCAPSAFTHVPVAWCPTVGKKLCSSILISASSDHVTHGTYMQVTDADEILGAGRKQARVGRDADASFAMLKNARTR